MQLTKEQSLTLENRKLKHIIADLLYALQEIAKNNSPNSKTNIAANEAIKIALVKYTEKKY